MLRTIRVSIIVDVMPPDDILYSLIVRLPPLKNKTALSFFIFMASSSSKNQELPVGIMCRD
ncbi:MAG TPA: hypothetical protein VKR53_02055 [Puia sp.]|nr:hypothetical protein [Puia sp.]